MQCLGLHRRHVKRVFQAYSGHLKCLKRAAKTFVQALQKWLPRLHSMTQTEAVSKLIFFGRREGGGGRREMRETRNCGKILSNQNAE